MLNPFPIQFLALLGYFILRVVLGWLLFWQGYNLIYQARFNDPEKLPPKWLLWGAGLFEIIIGLQFLFGLMTQIAALLTIAFAGLILIIPKSKIRTLLPDTSFWLLVIGVCLCLFITGAGLFAYDLPI